MTRRVVVTGIGMVTPLGNNLETTWNNIKEGNSGVASTTILMQVNSQQSFALK